MVRNSVVQHPSAWQQSGYNEIQNPPQRYVLINREKLIARCGFGTDVQLRKAHREWVEKAISGGINTREPEWSKSIAVGNERFVRGVLEKLQHRAKGLKVIEGVDRYQIEGAAEIL